MLKDAYAEAIDAEGSAEIENAKFIDSISGHLEKLKNAWQELWANVTTREFVNTIIDFGTAILKAVNNLGLLKTALIAISSLDILKFLLKGDGFTSSIVNSILQASDAKKSAISQMGKQLVEVTDGSSAGVKLTKEVADKLISEGSDKVLKYKLVKSMSEAGEEGAQSLSSNFISNVTSQGLGKALAEGTTKATEGVEKLGQALWAVKGPILIVTAAIGTLAAVLKTVDILNLDASETAKEAKEITSAFQESQATIKEHKQTIDELSTSYTELSKGVNTTTNANLTLSDEEYQQYLNTCNQIADLYPELVAGYDLQGNAILNLKGNVDALTESLIKEQEIAADTLIHGGLDEEQQKSWWQRFLHWGDDKSIQKDYQNNYKNYEAFQEVRDHFSNQSVTLDDYNNYRQELMERSGQGDTYAGQLLHQLYLLADNKIVSNNTELEQLLRNVSEQSTPEGFDKSQKNVQSLIKANLDKNKNYQDLVYRSNEEIQKNASNLFTNIINGLSPEQLNELMTSSESLEDITANIAQTINNLLTDTSNNQINWSEILSTKDLNNAVDGYQDSFDKLHKLGYTDQAIFSMADMGKVGNVNLNTDRAIQWNEDNLNKYIEQLRGWNEGLSDEEIKNKFKNETSTVFGSGDTFDFGKGTIDLSFATITEDGRLLDIDELYDYIQTILTRAEHSGEPLTIDTVLKFDAQGISDKNGNTIKNMIAGEGFNASEAMHEIELLKGYGDTTGFIDILHQYKDKYGSFITDILQMSGDARSGLQKITNFQDILKDIDNYNVGEGILANANMGDFTKLTTLYKKAFVDAFADSGINGEDLFNSMFTDKSVLELNDRFAEVLQTSPVTAMNREAREQAKELFSTLSQDEADAFLQAFNGAKNFEEVLNNYHGNLRALASGAYEAVVNIEDATAAVSTLTSALSSSASGNGLSEEEIGNIKTLFQDVVDFDENKLLENTANGVHLNVEELERLNKEYADFNIKKQSKRLDYYNEKLEESSKELDRLNKEWANAKDDDTKQRYADLYKGEQTVRQGIEDNISALQREIAQYASLTSAYNQYVQAQSSVNENARYENIGSGYDTTKDLIERGWIGQDDVRAYLNMFTQDDMMTASSEELYAVWDKIDDKINSAGYSLKDFFTYDENGKSTSDGIFNFLDTVKQAAKDSGQYSEETLNKLVSKDKEGNYSFDFDIIGGDNKIADLLGVDLSLIQAIIQAARDAGFEVQMTEALPGLESLTDKIRNARDRLKELGLTAQEIDKYKVDLSLDFSNAENYESATKTLLDSIDEIKNSDMSPEVKDASLDYVNGQLDAIIAKKAILSLPTSLSYDTSEVETGFQNLYASMQNYWLLQNELTQRKTLGLDTSKNEADLEAMTKDIFGLLKAMDEADREKLGFGDIDFTADTEKILSQIKEKLKEEDLELHIPTTLDDPNGDPTKGLDSQKITIDIQFSVDGKTLVLNDITSVQQAADNLDGTNANVNATADTAQAEEGLAGVTEEKRKAEGPFEVEGKGKNIGTLQSAIKNARAEARDKSFTITALSSGFSGIIDFFKNIYNKITNKSVTITTNYATTGGGGNVGGGKRAVPLNGSGYNGTAHALGTAYARGTSGNWGVPEDQDALVGELGEELVVFLCHYIQ
jgi:BMFP domain-containing protein YqiC